MTVYFTRYGVPEKYIGVSTSTKPTAAPIGSTCYETDTKKLFITADGATWVETNTATPTVG